MASRTCGVPAPSFSHTHAPASPILQVKSRVTHCAPGPGSTQWPGPSRLQPGLVRAAKARGLSPAWVPPRAPEGCHVAGGGLPLPGSPRLLRPGPAASGPGAREKPAGAHPRPPPGPGPGSGQDPAEPGGTNVLGTELSVCPERCPRPGEGAARSPEGHSPSCGGSDMARVLDPLPAAPQKWGEAGALANSGGARLPLPPLQGGRGAPSPRLPFPGTGAEPCSGTLPGAPCQPLPSVLGRRPLPPSLVRAQMRQPLS